ncbi:hypothetical protein PGN35_025095 [Nodosilinea sp. PGN35]|uniref:hypothetical protein n=1 Tax=Nodosilinea sp. PGN35 TaxID=3020489 RepID=UPI0023B23758|nr:hypothetical protein [Nodosilinea sp. TSF1-S3]MDF0370254.1 hypothetical protein [Nodosilinea sp. TSF1-S3]
MTVDCELVWSGIWHRATLDSFRPPETTPGHLALDLRDRRIDSASSLPPLALDLIFLKASESVATAQDSVFTQTAWPWDGTMPTEGSDPDLLAAGLVNGSLQDALHAAIHAGRDQLHQFRQPATWQSDLTLAFGPTWPLTRVEALLDQLVDPQHWPTITPVPVAALAHHYTSAGADLGCLRCLC